MNSQKDYKFFGIVGIIMLSSILWAAGKVYLVLGSDTAIWDGMGTSTFNDTYNQSLFTDPAMNAYTVMSSNFRNDLTDSYGNRLKMTWWMMGGNIFRYATNKNFPVANTMTLYLMQKYYGDFINEIGDEISIHYHTFAWTDYDQDGIWYWNQARNFMECYDDFNYTLCQYLLEENIFPVSFRSGWHYMDENWQHYLNELVPYAMHDDWPNKRTSDPEPIDNIYDWSISPSYFAPWHPSLADYRIPGDGPAWNLRSTHFSTALNKNLVDSLFYNASLGDDQMICLWGHLPETDFLTNIQSINTLAHQMEEKYPGVTFRYCSAVEAMQYWQSKSDTIAPVISIEEVYNGNQVTFRITSDEPIFQRIPFVALKDIYENYHLLDCEPIGVNQWETTAPYDKSFIAKVGVAVCDSLGNQTKQYLYFLPNDIYVDFENGGYNEISGNWVDYSAPKYTWGRTARYCQITSNDTTLIVDWRPTIPETRLYHIMFQAPAIANQADTMIFKVYTGTQCIDTIIFNQALTGNDWNYITTVELPAGNENYLRMEVPGSFQTGKVILTDVVKFSPLITDYNLVYRPTSINYGDVSQLDTACYELTLSNSGIGTLQINAIYSNNSNLIISENASIQIPAMNSLSLPVKLYAEEIGTFSDTLYISSNDIAEPLVKIPVAANITNHFLIVDNADTNNYFEYGTWRTSNAQAYGTSSRYAPLNQNPRAYAVFTFSIRKGGKYDLYEIVPTTVNASDDVIYIVSNNGIPIDSTIINQNTNSGIWVKVAGNYNFFSGDEVTIKVLDTGNNTNSGAVLRADAIRLSWTDEPGQGISGAVTGVPTAWALDQNYPNPFNSETTICYTVPKAENVKLIVYNSLGQVVQTLIDKRHQPGFFSIKFKGDCLSSGVYFYRLSGEGFNIVKKFMLIK